MARPKLPEGKVLTPAERQKRYRAQAKNKVTIREYETKVRAPRNILARLETNRVESEVPNDQTKKKPSDKNVAPPSDISDRLNIKFNWSKKKAADEDSRVNKKNGEVQYVGMRRVLSGRRGKRIIKVLIGFIKECKWGKCRGW